MTEILNQQVSIPLWQELIFLFSLALNAYLWIRNKQNEKN
jgi:hypothetical protein